MSYSTAERSWDRNTFQSAIGLLLISPFVFLIEMSVYQHAKKLVDNPTHDTRLMNASYEILKDRNIRVIRLSLPEEVLRHSRGLATSMSLNRTIQRDGELVRMWAVSRNAMGILLARDVRYIDPVALPSSLKTGLILPFDSSLLSNYLLIPQVVKY